MNIKNLFNKFVNASLGLILALTASVVSAAQTEVTYYVPDALGSPIAAMDAAGNVKWRKHYRPFGEEIEQGTEAQDNRIGYTGHVHDSDTALTYMGARYYDPQIGRFLSLDPVGVNPNDPRTFNRYAYANNNPYKFVDPDGRSPEYGQMVQGISGYSVATVEYLSRTPAEHREAVQQALNNDPVANEDFKQYIFLLNTNALLSVGGEALLPAAKVSGKLIGILRDASMGKGNFGLGSGTRVEAEMLGKAWVGDGYKVASDGKTLISKDGLKQYRPPSYKPRLDKTQANFEQKFPGQKSNQWQSNGHLDITD